MIGDVIKQKRKERDLTQTELAAILGTTQAEIARWETNRAKPNTKNLYHIAKALSVSIDEMISVDELQEEIILVVRHITNKDLLNQILLNLCSVKK